MITSAVTRSVSPNTGIRSWIQTAGKKANRAFWISVGGIATYKLFDMGLANVLAIDTLVHGTGPTGFLGINLQGGNPYFGGCSKGSTQIFKKILSFLSKHPEIENYPGLIQKLETASNEVGLNTQNHFYVFSDKSLESSLENSFLLDLTSYVLRPRVHAIMSGMAESESEKTTRLILGIASGLCTPILKFRFKPEDISHENPQFLRKNPHFEKDPDYEGFHAYRTKDCISPSCLGITGSILQGLDNNTFRRMKERPLKAFTGAVLLGSSYQIGLNTWRYFKNPQQEISTPSSISYSRRFAKGAIRAIKLVSWGGVAMFVLII